MSSTFTMYLRQQLLNAVFRPDAYVAPTSNLQVALCTAVPPSNAAIGQLVEPTATEYARQSYPVGSASWAPTNFGELYNVTKVTFPQVVSNWGLVMGWALLDTGAGQCMAVGSLATPFVATAGVIPFLDPGAISFGLYD